MDEPTPKKKRPGRPHVAPPPPPPLGWRRELEALRPLGVGLRLSLWRALRRVRLWADTPQESREGLFTPPTGLALRATGRACVLAPGLIEPLGVFTSLLRAPHQAEGERLAEACRQVYEWADAQGMLPAAVLFAEAAASAEPANPVWANDAARLCRRAAYNERAAEWYLRAFKLATHGRSRGDHKQSLWAMLGYGALMKDLGRYEEAKHYYNRAARKAYRLGWRRDAAEAHHDLMGLAAETGEFGAAEWHARQALKFYPSGHPYVPALAHDWAFLLVRLHHFAPAFDLLESAVPQIELPQIQTIAWSTMAWAAAGSGHRQRYEEAEERTLCLMQLHEAFAPAALVHLAEGSRLLEQWDRAEQCAAEAVEMARSRNESSIEREAEALLHAIRSRETPRGEMILAPNRIEGMSRRFKARLVKHKAPGRSRPGANSVVSGSPPKMPRVSVA